MFKPARTTLFEPRIGNLTAYDFESTGLNPALDQVSQIGALIIGTDFNTIGMIDSLVKLRLDVMVDPNAALITKISPFEMRNGVSERDAILNLIALHEKYKSTHFIGYNNLRFDSKVLHQCIYRNLTHPTPDKIVNKQLDVYQLVLLMFALRRRSINFTEIDGKPSLKLENMCKANGITLNAAHNALADIEATAELQKLIKNTEPVLYDYWLGLSLPNNIDKLCKSNEWLLMTHTAFGHKTRYTRPVAPAIVKPFGYYALDLTLDFNTDEKFLFQKVNKFQSPLLSEVTEAQGERLLSDLELSSTDIANALEKLGAIDVNALFEEWQTKHPKPDYPARDDALLRGYDKLTEEEQTDLIPIQSCAVVAIEPSLLKTRRIRTLASRLVAFQSERTADIFNLEKADLEELATYLSGKLPENNATTKARIESIETLQLEAQDVRDKQVLSNLKFAALHQVQVWETLISTISTLLKSEHSIQQTKERTDIKEVNKRLMTDNRFWLDQLIKHTEYGYS